MGLLVGNQQHKTAAITLQTQTIAELEQKLSHIVAKLDQSKKQCKQHKPKLKHWNHHSNNSYNNIVKIQFSNRYQFDIYFLTNSMSLTPHAQQGLIKLANLLQNNPNIYANIKAHSDWRGNNEANSQLAKQRLSAVSNQLLTTNYGGQANEHNGLWDETLFYDRRVTISLSYFE
jgi:outer membrane protein OmpA-like peptidoglycan-associated protein